MLTEEQVAYFEGRLELFSSLSQAMRHEIATRTGRDLDLAECGCETCEEELEAGAAAAALTSVTATVLARGGEDGG